MIVMVEGVTECSRIGLEIELAPPSGLVYKGRSQRQLAAWVQLPWSLVAGLKLPGESLLSLNLHHAKSDKAHRKSNRYPLEQAPSTVPGAQRVS